MLHIGYVQGVHGLKGDLKVKCLFEYPEKVFKVHNKIFLNDEEHEITSSKFYKGFYLVTIDNLKDINLTEKYIGYDVYFKREDLKLTSDEYLIADLLEMEIIFNNEVYGKVKEILDNGFQKILVINNARKMMIPLVDEYVENIDLTNQKIYVKNIEGFLE